MNERWNGGELIGVYVQLKYSLVVPPGETSLSNEVRESDVPEKGSDQSLDKLDQFIFWWLILTTEGWSDDIGSKNRIFTDNATEFIHI